MDQTEQRNLIWHIVALSTAILAFLTMITIVLCAVFIPRKYGDFISALGFRNAGLVSYEYHYDNTKDINDLYYWNIKSVLANNSHHIIKSYEKLSVDTEYESFIEYVEGVNAQNSISKLAMVYVSNEDNYLKGNYVKALYQIHDDDSFVYAYNDMISTEVSDISGRYNFVLAYYINIANNTELANNISQDVALRIQRYKDELYQLYKSNDATNDVSKYQLSIINYRIINILSSMKILNEKLGFYNIEELDTQAQALSIELLSLTR